MSKTKQPLSVAATFGRRVKERRASMDIAQQELADLTGITRAYVSLIEQGKREPSLSMFVRLCDSMGKSPDWFLSVE